MPCIQRGKKNNWLPRPNTNILLGISQQWIFQFFIHINYYNSIKYYYLCFYTTFQSKNSSLHVLASKLRENNRIKKLYMWICLFTNCAFSLFTFTRYQKHFDVCGRIDSIAINNLKSTAHLNYDGTYYLACVVNWKFLCKLFMQMPTLVERSNKKVD